MPRMTLLTTVLLALSRLVAGAQPQDPLSGATLRLERDGRSSTYTLVPVAPPATQPATRPGTPSDERFTVFLVDGMAPATVHVHALNLQAVAGNPLDCRYEWDFGDPGSPYNVLPGWNAAHHYREPGQYTISLRLTDPRGNVTLHAQQIRLMPERRAIVFVAADGDDRNDGGDPRRPLRSWTRASLAVRDNVKIALRRGDVFDVVTPMKVNAGGVQIVSYGDPALPQPVLRFSGELKSVPMIETLKDARDLVVSDLCFDSAYNSDTEKDGMPDAIRGSGQNLTIRNCTFVNVGYALNSNGKPRGVLVQDCVSPLETGLRSYFAWVQGQDHVYLGNRVANSTREHVLRVNDGHRLLIFGNDFSNLDRRPADKIDTGKGSCVVQSGSFAYVSGNRLRRGPIGVGPLDGRDGMKNPAARFRFAVVENNRIGTTLFVNHGADDVVIRNNLARKADAAAIQVAGFSAEFKRGTSNLTIEDNTILNPNPRGGMLRVENKVDGIRLLRNVYVAPQLETGTHGSAALYVAASSLAWFSEISDNVWPVARPTAYAQGGVHYVWPTWSDQRGYLDPDEWRRLPPVRGDRFLDLPLDPLPALPGAGADLSRLPAEDPGR